MRIAMHMAVPVAMNTGIHLLAVLRLAVGVSMDWVRTTRACRLCRHDDKVEAQYPRAELL